MCTLCGEVKDFAANDLNARCPECRTLTHLNLYRLDGHRPVAMGDDELLAWAEWFATADRHVGLWRVGDVRVSTVFLGIDHGWSSEPLLFETMVFGGSLDGLRERCSTWEEAEAQHQEVLRRVMACATTD